MSDIPYDELEAALERALDEVIRLRKDKDRLDFIIWNKIGRASCRERV